jgi:hypothetical protein
MPNRNKLREDAYKYVLNILSRLPPSDNNKDWIEYIPLEELRLIKEGIADPSPTLVALLKDLLNGVVPDSVVDSYLVTPFKNYEIE